MSNTLKTIIWITQGENTVSYTWHTFLTRGVGFFVKERENAEKNTFYTSCFSFLKKSLLIFEPKRKVKLSEEKLPKSKEQKRWFWCGF
jgi:hypothetical protein